MKKLFIMFMLLTLMSGYLVAQAGTTQPVAPAGSGTLVSPYLIANLANLRWVSQSHAEWHLDGDRFYHFLQTANIDATETNLWYHVDEWGYPTVGWRPITGYQMGGGLFVYDGGGYSISNLYSEGRGNSCGFWGHLGARNYQSYFGQNTIRNVHLVNIDFNIEDIQNSYIGGIAGYAERNSLILNCTTSGTITGAMHAGGIVGNLMWGSHIVNSSSSVNISSNSSYHRKASVGGIVGFTDRGYLVTIKEGQDPTLLRNSVTNSFSTGNITFTGSTREDKLGGIVGEGIEVDILYCFSTGNISSVNTGNWNGLLSETCIGGIAGESVPENPFNPQKIFYCYSTGNITANGADFVLAGGVVGAALDTHIYSSHSTSDISVISQGESHVGGLVGTLNRVSIQVRSTIAEESYFNGTISSEGPKAWAGGLFGSSTDPRISFYPSIDITYSFSDASISAIQTQGSVGWAYAGGIIAETAEKCSVIGYSYTSGSVTATGENVVVGGFIAMASARMHSNPNPLIQNHNQIDDSFSRVTLNSLGIDTSYVGGFVGYIREDAGGPQAMTIISKSYWAGYINITGNTQSVGGVIGYLVDSELLEVTNSFWDIETSDVLDGVGNDLIPPPDLTSAFGLPSDEMKVMSTYTSVGWNFSTIWNINPTLNNGYPYLRFFNPPEPDVFNPPTNLTFTQDGRNVTLNWSPPEPGSTSDLLGYTVRRNADLLTDTPITDLTLTDLDVPNGTYYYRVVAVYEDGNSVPIQVYVPININLNPPQNLTHYILESDVTLSWEPPEDGSTSEFIGYSVFRDTMPLTTEPIIDLYFTDIEVPNGEYEYSVYAVYEAGNSVPVSVEVLVNFVSNKDIATYYTTLTGNYPNPFNPETTVKFDLASDSTVLLEIYNIKGQKINTLVNSDFRAGSHNVVWSGIDDNGSSVSNGIYFYRMTTDEYSATKRIFIRSHSIKVNSA